MKKMTQKLIGCAAVALALLSTFNLTLSTAHAQGALTPPGPPAPTMKSLDQIEARTPISSAPYSINQPGSYYLTTNLTVSSANAIFIGTNDVTLDLNGFTISSTDPTASNTGILLNEGLRDITVLNGHIAGSVTNNGSGVYGGSGFGYGISFYNVTAPVNVRVSGVSISGCLADGIYLGGSLSTVVEFCTVRTVGGTGIVASTIKGSTAVDCGSDAISGWQVSDCLGSSHAGIGIAAYTVQNSYGYSETGGGAISCQTAQNCYAFDSGNGAGLSSENAENCYGQSDGSGTGISSDGTALNCVGVSYGGEGLFAIVANGCIGTTFGTGTYALQAEIANVCYGSPLDVTYNVNSH